MPRYIVTGAAGFIGSRLCAALLRAEHTVIGIDNLNPSYDLALKHTNLAGLKHEQFRFEQVDICDAEPLTRAFVEARPDGVIHLAALTGVRPSVLDPKQYAHVNVEGLITVLDATRATPCRHVVFASSSSVYGVSPETPFHENSPLRPISPYGVTKLSGEMMCRAYAHLHGLAISAVRFFTVYGPGQRPDLAIFRFFQHLAADEPLSVYGDGTTSRDYTFVDDIVRGVRAAIDATAVHHDAWFRIWNLGGAHPISLRDLIGAMQNVAGRRARINRLPEQPGDVPTTFADLTRSQAELGYAPQTSLEDGLRQQWEWMLDVGLLKDLGEAVRPTIEIQGRSRSIAPSRPAL